MAGDVSVQMIQPDYVSDDGRIMLYCADALDVLPTLEAGSIEHIITDPPYEVEAHTLQRRVKRNGGIMNLEPLDFCKMSEAVRIEFSKQTVRICSGWAIVFCQAEAVALWRDTLQDAGAIYKRAMVWIKPDGMPQYSGDRPGMGYESIVAAWCSDGGSSWNGGGRHGVFNYNKSGDGGPNEHPTQKPIRLISKLVALFTDEGDTVLDCFMGSGTTGVAAVKLGRRFIGVELSREYYNIALKRIQQAEAQPMLLQV